MLKGKMISSFAYVVITKEEFPRVLIVRETELENFKSCQNLANSKPAFRNNSGTKQVLNSSKPSFIKIFGPYTSKKQLEIALKLIRKIFPYHSAKQISRNCCFDHQIGLCPGPYAGAISKKDYLKNIRGYRNDTCKGKKKQLVSALKKEMKEYSQET